MLGAFIGLPFVCSGVIAITNPLSVRDAVLLGLGLSKPSAPEMDSNICQSVIGGTCPEDIILEGGPVTPEIDSVVEYMLQEPYKLALAAREERTDWQDKESLDNGLLTMAFVSFDGGGKAQEFRVVSIGVETGDVTQIILDPLDRHNQETEQDSAAIANVYRQRGEALINSPIDGVLVTHKPIDETLAVVFPGGNHLFSDLQTASGVKERSDIIQSFISSSTTAFKWAKENGDIEAFGISPEYLLFYFKDIFSPNNWGKTLPSLGKVWNTPKSQQFFSRAQKGLGTVYAGE